MERLTGRLRERKARRSPADWGNKKALHTQGQFSGRQPNKSATFENTLEMSRSGVGPLSTLACLKYLGIEGYQKKLGKLLDTSIYLKEQLGLLSENQNWVSVFVCIKPDWMKDMSLNNLQCMSAEQLSILKQLNTDFANWIKENNLRGNCPFTFTASSVCKIPNTNIDIGALKLYPMFSEFDKDYVDLFLQQLSDKLKEYKKINRIIKEDKDIHLDPVYRKV